MSEKTVNNSDKSNLNLNEKKDTKNKSFDVLVSEYGLRRDIAAAVKIKCRLDRSGKVSEEKFVAALKCVTTQKAV